MTEYLLTTNEFSEPKSVTNQEAYGVLLLRLFLLNPGTNPLYPGMGIGISKYRFIDNDSMIDLRSKIIDQIHTYFPESFASTAEIKIKIKPSKYLSIIVISNGESYIYDTENSDTPIKLSEMTN